jgi:hypothetical protein
MRRFVVLLVVLAVILFAADRIGCRVAEGRIADQIKSDQQLNSRPAVTIHGFPFLTQALRGRYQLLDVAISDLSVQDGLTVDHVDVELRGLHLKLSDALSGAVTGVPVDSAETVATVSYASLDAAAKANLPDKGLSVKFSEGHDHLVAVNGSYSGSGLSVQVKAEAKVSVRDGELVVGLEPASLAALPTALRGQLTSLLGSGYQLPALPFGLDAKSVTVGSAGVTVRATATSVNLR